MTYEKDTKGIPEYALQPAKPSASAAAVILPAAKTGVTPAEAVYHREKFTCLAGEQRMIYQFEEDILVPDTRADMREILLIDGSCDVNPMQKKLIPKADDLLNMTGTVVLQTLYCPEGTGAGTGAGAGAGAAPGMGLGGGSGAAEPVAVTTKVPYKYQWALSLSAAADAVFSCSVKSVDAMVINERKFRVKVSLEFTARLFSEQEMEFFEGLRDGELEMKRREVPIVCLGAVKRDEVTIDETFRPKDSGTKLTPDCILRQEFAVAENYRQVTTEKIVINGFIYVSLLYMVNREEAGASGASGEMGSGRKLCQMSQRIEFTQFIPLEKDLRGKTFSAVRTTFSAENLKVAAGFDGEEGEENVFRITGEVKSRVELFESRRRTMVTDAYHRSKIFGCERNVQRISGTCDGATAETSVREIVSLTEGEKAVEAIFCGARLLSSASTVEKGRVIVTGEVLASALWRGADMTVRAERRTIAFRGIVEMESAIPGQTAEVRPMVKSAWTELINDKQLEVNVSLLLGVELSDVRELVLLTNPHFQQETGRRDYPMMIASLGRGESLWDVAKRCRTTEENLRTANRLDGEPRPGQRLLIVR